MRTLNPEAHSANRCRILDAARSLFAEEGFHAASMSALAKACRLTKAALYHYFPSKQSILGALHHDMVLDAEAKIEAFPRFKNLNEAMLAAGGQYLKHFADPKHRQMMQLSFKLGLHDMGKADPKIAFEGQRLDEKLLGIFQPYMPKGTPKKRAQVFAQQFFGALYFRLFAAEQLCPGMNAVDPELYLKQLVQTFTADPKAALKGAL